MNMKLQLMRPRLGRPAIATPDPETFAPRSILLASEGKAIALEAIDFAARLAQKAKAPVHVFMIARIWGSSFGLPHPGLMPTKREWKAQHDRVADTVQQLKRRGVEATGGVVSSRNASGRILAEIKRGSPDAVVMAAPPARHWLYAGLFWDQEPYRVRRLAAAPVYIVVTEDDAKPTDQNTRKKHSPRLAA
jgi:nucleotide-binding universal stress UspA family protein